MMTFKGDKRREHLSQTRELLRAKLRVILGKAASGLSYSEVYGEALGALEDIAGAPAAEIRRRAQVCRDEYCKPCGGSYRNITETKPPP